MASEAALYLDTSIALRATLEQGSTPDSERRIAAAAVLVTSRLALVESARALLRVRVQGGVPEDRLADARRELDALWNRCELWELSPAVCDLASLLARTSRCARSMRFTWRRFSSRAGVSMGSSCLPPTDVWRRR